MKKFVLTCDMGHDEPFKKEVMAESMELAIEMLMADADVLAHVQAAHPEWVGKAPEEMKAGVMGMVKEEMATPEGGAMA